MKMCDILLVLWLGALVTMVTLSDVHGEDVDSTQNTTNIQGTGCKAEDAQNKVSNHFGSCVCNCPKSTCNYPPVTCNCNCPALLQCNKDNQLGFIIIGKGLPDSSFTASSRWPQHGPERARLDRYFDDPCSWSAADGDTEPWIEVDLVAFTTVAGIAIKKRCDYSTHGDGQYVKIYSVKALVDGMWDTVHTQIEPSYIGEYQFAFFQQPTRAQKWRVHVLSYHNHASMKFDLIGYI